MRRKLIVLHDVRHRISTGPLQLGTDWPGLYIRGDGAMEFDEALAAALIALRLRLMATNDHRLGNAAHALSNLKALLRSPVLSKPNRQKFWAWRERVASTEEVLGTLLKDGWRTR